MLDSLTLGAYIAYNAYKAILNIRNLPEAVHSRLRVRAARNRQSMEAEARAILTEACAPETAQTASSLPEWVPRLYGGKKPPSVVDELIRERRREGASE